jgi:hypothetical protein
MCCWLQHAQTTSGYGLKEEGTAQWGGQSVVEVASTVTPVLHSFRRVASCVLE